MEEWIARVASCDRKHWLGESATPPAERLDEILEKLGLRLKSTRLGKGIFGRLDLGRSLIELNKHLPDLIDYRANPWAIGNFTIGHEIGHHQVHRWEMARGIWRPEQEREANFYAAVLLLPRSHLVETPQWAELLRARAAGQLEAKRNALAHQIADRFRITPSAVHIRFSELLELEATPVAASNLLQFRSPSLEGEHTFSQHA